MLNIKSQLVQLSLYTFEIETDIALIDIDSIVVVQGIIVVDNRSLVAALLIDAAVLRVVVRCLAKF